MSPFNNDSFQRTFNDYINSQQYQKAEALCLEALGQQPNNEERGQLYNNLGYMYEHFLNDKTFDDILEHYVLSLQVDESNPNSHFNLANFLLEQGMQHLLRSLELNPSHQHAQRKLNNLQPLKMNAVLELDGTSYKVSDITADGIKASKVGGPPNQQYNLAVGIDSQAGVGGYRGGMEVDSGGYGGRKGTSGERDDDDDITCCRRFCLSEFLWFFVWLIAFCGVGFAIFGIYNYAGLQLPGFSLPALLAKPPAANVPIPDVATSSVPASKDITSSVTPELLFVLDCSNNKTFADQIAAVRTIITNTSSLAGANVSITQRCGSYNGAIPQFSKTVDYNITQVTNQASYTLLSSMSACMNSTASVCFPVVSSNPTDISNLTPVLELVNNQNTAKTLLVFVVFESNSVPSATTKQALQSIAALNTVPVSRNDLDAVQSIPLETSTFGDINCKRCLIASNTTMSTFQSKVTTELTGAFTNGAVAVNAKVYPTTVECNVKLPTSVYAVVFAVPLLILSFIAMFCFCQINQRCCCISLH